jgi:hypothetical protein
MNLQCNRLRFSRNTCSHWNCRQWGNRMNWSTDSVKRANVALSSTKVSTSPEDIIIRKITPTTNMAVARQMLNVINWAYRGKPDVPGWTGIRCALMGLLPLTCVMCIFMERTFKNEFCVVSKCVVFLDEAAIMEGPRTTLERLIRLVLECDEKQSIVFYAEVNGNVGGCIHLQSKEEKAVEFGLFAVDPSLQTCGIGRYVYMLLKWCVLCSHRCRFIHLFLYTESCSIQRRSMQFRSGEQRSEE